MEVKVAKTKKERDDAFSVRRTVFIEEQGVSEEIEIDEHEDEAIHLVVYYNKQPVGAGRIRLFDGYGKGERICVLNSFRKQGIGEIIMEAMEMKIREEHISKLKLHAQTSAQAFYEKIGYSTTSALFYEAGIPHVSMEKELQLQ